ncbi:MAG TPA: glycosyltransferase family 4 protein [Candidatus Eisenbacteria bacterium]
MNVAMVAGSYPPMRCGIGDYTRELCGALARAGVEPTVEPPPGPAAPFGWTFRDVRRLVAGIAALRPDVVHVQYPGRGYRNRIAPTFFGALWRSGGSGAPLVVTLHEFRIAHPLRKLAALNLARGASALIVPASTERASLLRTGLLSGTPVTVVPIGSNIPLHPLTAERRRSLRASWGAGDGDVVLCYFGFVQRNKDVPRLRAAFARAREQDLGLRLVLIGESAGTPPAGVTAAGYLPAEQVSECLSASDLCVLPYVDGVSARRGTFWAALEHGLPVVTTAAGAEPAAMGLEHGRNVWLVSARGSAEELAGAIVTLARSPELRAKLGVGGRALGAANGWDEVARRTVEVYDSVIGRASESRPLSAARGPR